MISENQKPILKLSVFPQQLSFKNNGFDQQCIVCYQKNAGQICLPCGHSFCKLCIIKLSSKRCPLDRKQFRLKIQIILQNQQNIAKKQNYRWLIKMIKVITVICMILLYFDLNEKHKEIWILEQKLDSKIYKNQTQLQAQAQAIKCGAKLIAIEQELTIIKEQRIKYSQKNMKCQRLLNRQKKVNSLIEKAPNWFCPEYFKFYGAILLITCFIYICWKRKWIGQF